MANFAQIDQTRIGVKSGVADARAGAQLGLVRTR